MSEIAVLIESETVASSAAVAPITIVKSIAVEEDLKDLLPSVKNLAIAFTTENQSYNNNSVVNQKMDVVDDIVGVIAQPAAESYVPPYNKSYYPAEPVSNVKIQNGSIAATHGEGDVVRARSKSPIPAAGNFRSSIAFFENLKK